MPSGGDDISARGIDPRSLSLHSHAPDDLCGREEQDKDGTSAVVTRDFVAQDVILPDAEDSLDGLIAELENEDGKEPDPEELSIAPGTERPTDPDLLLTGHNRGLTDIEVVAARRKYGWNRMKEERQSNIVKFFMLFVGPVQFVMEVSTRYAQQTQWSLQGMADPHAQIDCGTSGCWSGGLD